VRLIAWSLDHRRIILGSYGLVLVLAVLSLAWWIPTRLNPALPSPLLAVLTSCPNQSASQVERSTTNPLERDLARLPQLLHMRSMSMHELSLIVLEFPYGRDISGLLPVVAAQLPSGSRVVRYDPLDLPVLSLALRYPGQDSLWLRQLLEKEAVSAFRQIEGVSRVSLFGPRQQLEVYVKPDLSGVPLGQPDLARPDPARLTEAENLLSGLRDLEELNSLKLGARPLREQALVRLVAGHDSPRYRYNGQEGFELSLFQSARASSPLLVGRLRQAEAELKARYPGLLIEEAYNNAHFVEVMQASVWLELLLAVVFTGAVVWFFLGEVRGTLIALATLPTALALTLIGFVPLGLSLNSSSLVGLLLALGRLVDDTVIDLHAVAAHRAQGKSVGQAALEGCSEVRPAVVSSTLVLALAMLPLTWCGGLTQDMFQGIIWPFLLSLGASLLVSLTLTPVLISLIYRGAPHESGWESRYRGWLASALKRPGTVLGVAASACYLAWQLVPLIGSEMMPAADTGQIYVELEARPNSSTDETSKLAAGVEEILRRLPEVRGVSCEIGMDSQAPALSGYDLGASHSARMLVTLVDSNRRRRDLWEIADQVYGAALHDVPGIRRLVLKEMGSDVMASAMAPVELVLRGPNARRLSWLGEASRDLGGQIRGLHMVGTSWSLGRAPRVLFRPPPGLGKRVGETNQGVPIVLLDGRPFEEEQALIEHQDGLPSLSVTGTTRRGGPGSMRLAMQLQMAIQNQLPFPAGYQLLQRGDMLTMMDSFQRLLQGLALGGLLVYGALLFWFHDFRLPLIMLVSIPLELSGVLVALLLAGQIFSSVSLLGLVVLHGMDMTASILLLQRIESLRLQGLSPREAILLGAPQRLRPVLMTVLVTLAVMLPLAFFPNPGMDAYSPLATVILGGLTVSSLLTLLVIPVLYCLVFGGISSHGERIARHQDEEGNYVRSGAGEQNQPKEHADGRDECGRLDCRNHGPGLR
jgi:HAE1 family hydrophobic/amphiphilic exporter-1